MNDELYEFYANCLIEARAPERAAPLAELVALLIDFEYGDELAEIHNVAKENLSDDIITIERIIIRCAVALAGTMGITLDEVTAYERPGVVLRLLLSLTGDFEDYEDFNTLYVIANSGETSEYILENMMRVMHLDQSIEVDGLIVHMEPRVLTVVINFLEAKLIEDELSGVDHDAQARLVRYIRQYPTNPMVNLFANAAYKLKPRVVANELNWEVEMPGNEMAIMYLVGLVTMDTDDYDKAYANLEVRVDWLPVEEDAVDVILRDAVIGLKAIYEVE